MPNVKFFALPRISCKDIHVKQKYKELSKKGTRMRGKWGTEKHLNIEEDRLFQLSIDLEMFKVSDRKNTIIETYLTIMK